MAFAARKWLVNLRNINKYNKSCYRSCIICPVRNATQRRTNNTLRRICNGKDRLKNHQKSGVYKLDCPECTATYVGQTGRNFETRYKEHMSAYRNDQPQRSHFAKHLLGSGHETRYTCNSWNCLNNFPKINNQLKSRWLHTTNTVNKTVAFKLSDIGEGIREVVIKEWFVKVGDKVQQFENICEVQSDKAAVTITSRYDGVVTKIYHEVDQTALVGQPLVDIEVDSSGDEVTPQSNSATKATEDVPKKETKSSQPIKVLTTPAVRRIAAQFQVDLSSINATGRNGRVLKEDILSHLNMSADKSNDVPDKALNLEAISFPMDAVVAREIALEDKIVPVTGFMKAMVKSMTEAMKIPHFVFSDEYDVTKLVKSRQELKELAQKRGVKLTYMPIIIKAASQSLLSYPVLNSSLDSSNENLIYKSRHNIGVAMDTPNGLVVPVIRNVQNKSIFEIAIEMNSLQEKGLKGQLGFNELTGGTFTISNIGIIGGTYTKPVILPPQVSIGALGKIQVLPRFDSEGNVIKAHILSVSWSADHRVIDGVTMARFSNQLKEYLEDPQKLILDL